MLTKKIYAQYLIDLFKSENNIPVSTSMKELNKYVSSSTSLGIALEYFGELDDEYKEYMSFRVGKIIVNTTPVYLKRGEVYMKDGFERFDEFMSTHTLTQREFLSLLPD